MAEGEYIGKKILEIMHDFNGIKIWASNGKLLSKINIKEAIENGASFTSFTGHGYFNLWFAYAFRDPTTRLPPGGYTLSDVNELNNSNKLTIAIIAACLTCKFDIDPNCLGWAFLSNEKGGSIGTIGCTALAYGPPGFSVVKRLIGFLELCTFRSYVQNATTLGMLWTHSINNYLNTFSELDAYHYKTVEEWELFGDPSLRIASLPPNKPSQPEGPTKGKKDREYYFTSYSTDPDNDKIYYLFDWGDGNCSEWLGPYKSGEIVNASHIWKEKGEYSIRVKARDIYGKESNWSDPLTIKITIKLWTKTYRSFKFFELLREIMDRLGLRGFIWDT